MKYRLGTKSIFIIFSSSLLSVALFISPAVSDHKIGHRSNGIASSLRATCPAFIAEKINAHLNQGRIGLFGSSLNSNEGNTRDTPNDCKITSADFVYSVQISTSASSFG